MATKRRTTTTVVTQTETRTRVRRLSSPEEKVLRMKQGISLSPDTPLEPKSTNPELLAKLKDIEAQLFLAAGRIEGVSKKQQIIDKLKKR